jgi:hypothetical protein
VAVWATLAEILGDDGDHTVADGMRDVDVRDVQKLAWKAARVFTASSRSWGREFPAYGTSRDRPVLDLLGQEAKRHDAMPTADGESDRPHQRADGVDTGWTPGSISGSYRASRLTFGRCCIIFVRR